MELVWRVDRTTVSLLNVLFNDWVYDCMVVIVIAIVLIND